MSYPYIIQGGNISIVIDNKPFTIANTHMNYEEIKECIKKEDWDSVKQLVDVKKLIVDYADGHVSIVGEQVYWKQTLLHGTIVTRLINMFKEGFSIVPLVRFIENLMENPSSQAVNELYDFLEKGNLPITPDGCFLAYKRVDLNYFDIHSKTVLNKPANLMTPDDLTLIASTVNKDVTVAVVLGTTIVTMERARVNSNRHDHCSIGLHFCSLDYLKNFGGDRTIILKINPKHVVSIPSDYNFTKGRCCGYAIVGEVANDEQGHKQAFNSNVQVNADNVIETTKTQPTKEEVQLATATSKKELSMTINAIRKREKRAMEKLALKK